MEGPTGKRSGQLACLGIGVAITLFVSYVSACGGGPTQKLVTQAEYGTDWPFIVPEVLLECRGGPGFPMVVVSLTDRSREWVDASHGSSFAVNGNAMTDDSLADLELIWRYKPGTVAVGDWLKVRVSVSQLLNRGLGLCEGHDEGGPAEPARGLGEAATYGEWVSADGWIAEREADLERQLKELKLDAELLGGTPSPEWPFLRPRIYLGCRGDTQAVTASLTELKGTPGSATYALNGPATRSHPSAEPILKRSAAEGATYSALQSLVDRGLGLCEAALITGTSQ
jgi:hypothetical protein